MEEMARQYNKQVFWIMGRGVSVSCGLDWNKKNWNDVRLEEIRERLKEIQQNVDTKPLDRLLDHCENLTDLDWKHTFSTLNWDTLFEKAINKRGWMETPKWMSSSHVYHWNGTIEKHPNNGECEKLTGRSPMVLPPDPPSSRGKSVEANFAFAEMGWAEVLVICGVSFANDCDDALICLIEWVQDELPIGEVRCIVVNYDGEALKRSCEKLQKYMRQPIIPVNQLFEDWINGGCKELQEAGVFHNHILNHRHMRIENEKRS